jgi:hypothetical protein
MLALSGVLGIEISSTLYRLAKLEASNGKFTCLKVPRSKIKGAGQ